MTFWCNAVKKGNSNTARMLAAIVLTGILLCLLCIRLNDQENAIPPPDRIIVYRNGVSMVLKPDDILYDRIFGAIVINTSETLETSIESDAVEEAKSYYAIEYIYDNKQSIAGNRQPSRIMCFFHGPYEGEAAFGDETRYSSGTSPFTCKKLFLVHEVDAILSRDD